MWPFFFQRYNFFFGNSYLSAMKRLLIILSVISACLTTACNFSGKAPVVGISCGHSAKGTDNLSSNYTKAILRAGGIPFIIPTIETAAQAEAVLSCLDGVVFSGGEDVNPAWYGEEVWNETVHTNPVRDRSDSLLARAALASGKPILGICRGEQLLNVMLGGSLYQDIPSQVAGAHIHRDTVHMASIVKGSVLSRIFDGDSVLVNSYHHQAVKAHAPGIVIGAWSDDGIVEAWENKQVWGFQFHPEKMLPDDERWLPLFKAFVSRL